MDMGSSSMAMGTATAATAAASASSTGMSMAGMGDMGDGTACKISMLWNWYTVDACFLSRSWHVRSSGAFAGSCIGVILLVMTLEALRRLAKEYDAYIIRRHAARNPAPPPSRASDDDGGANGKNGAAVRAEGVAAAPRPQRFTPGVGEQAVRALLHMLQFAVAYFVMLLAMYFNGYIILCIFIGAYIGSFLFGWQSLGLGGPSSEVTYCCG